MAVVNNFVMSAMKLLAVNIQIEFFAVSVCTPVARVRQVFAKTAARGVSTAFRTSVLHAFLLVKSVVITIADLATGLMNVLTISSGQFDSSF
jgi:hypothetical protein